MSTLTLDPRALRPALIAPPVSKSDAQRALVLAHLTGHASVPGLEGVTDEDLPSDVRVLRRALETLRSGARGARVDCADGGAPFRLFVTQAAITPGAHLFLTGTPRLGERPHGALFESLREALGGLRLVEGTPWPLEVAAASSLPTPRFRVRAGQSSQYASSLLLGCAALHLRDGRAWAVELDGPLTSPGYLDLTVTWMERFGFRVERSEARFAVRGYARVAEVPAVPGDWSSLGYLVWVAWRSGSRVAGADFAAAHPDKAVVRVAEELGLTLAHEPDGTFRVTGTAQRGLVASGAACPDLLPTLAAVALTLPFPSELRDVAVLRLKESDRLEGIRTMASAFGGECQLEGETLHLRAPETFPATFHIDARGDHRLAMSAATLSVLSGVPLTLAGPECVEKSFPGFWRQLERAGAALR